MQLSISKILKFYIRPKCFKSFCSLTISANDFKIDDNKQKYLTACCISDSINIRLVKNYFRNVDSVKDIKLPTECTKSAYAGLYKSDSEEKKFFVFNDGVISFWNMNLLERLEIIDLTKQFGINPINDYIKEEDDLTYYFHNEKTKIVNEKIFLKIPQTPEQSEKLIEQQMALSEALSQSVKLSIYESQFQEFSMNINSWLDQLKYGSKWKLKETQVLRQTGELFTMRHKITVSSHLTEIPDYYWERPDLEQLFNQIRKDFSIYQRTKILNEKLNLYCELTEILRNHIASLHSTKLEIMIIVLIMIEVLFECFSFYEKYSINVTNDLEEE